MRNKKNMFILFYLFINYNWLLYLVFELQL